MKTSVALPTETRAPLVTELLSAATATFKRRDEAEKKRQQFREAMAAKGALHPLQRVAWTGFEAESEELWAGSKEDIADAERARRVVAVARLQLAAQGGGDADDDDGFGGAGDAEEEEAPPPPPPAADAPAKSIESDYAADRSAQLAGAKRAQESAAAAAAEAAAARARKAEIRPDIEALRARVAQQAQQADANVHVHRRRMVRLRARVRVRVSGWCFVLPVFHSRARVRRAEQRYAPSFAPCFTGGGGPEAAAAPRLGDGGGGPGDPVRGHPCPAQDGIRHGPPAGGGDAEASQAGGAGAAGGQVPAGDGQGVEGGGGWAGVSLEGGRRAGLLADGSLSVWRFFLLMAVVFDDRSFVISCRV